MGNSFPIEFVGNPNFNFIQHIQNVKFCQSNAVGQVACQRRCLKCVIIIVIQVMMVQKRMYACGANVKHSSHKTPDNLLKLL